MTGTFENKQTLDHLIEKDFDEHHIEYMDFYSNHMVHGLVALEELGASKDRLKEFYDEYEEGKGHSGPLEPRIVSSHKVTEKNWKDHLFSKIDYDGYLKMFSSLISKNGVKDVVSKYYPQIMQGLSGSALHSLIHLGYALHCKNDLAVAEALAYTCYGGLEFGEIREGNNDQSIVEIAQSIVDDGLFNDFERVGFQSTMKKINNEHFDAICDYGSRWKYNGLEDSLKEIVQTVFIMLNNAGSNEFFLIHGVTSSFALCITTQYLSEKDNEKLLRYYVLALLGVFITRKLRGLEREKHPEIENIKYENWDEIIRDVITYKEPHKIKLVHVSQYFRKRFEGLDDIMFKTCAESIMYGDEKFF